MPPLRARGDSARHRNRPLSKYVYRFGGGTADGDRTMKDLLGGKGAGLAEMSRLGLNVPPGFTVSTEVCELYSSKKHADADAGAGAAWRPGPGDEMRRGISFIESHTRADIRGAWRRRRGGEARARRASARACAAARCRDDGHCFEPWLERLLLRAAVAADPSCERFLLDAYRRLLDMFGDVLGVHASSGQART